MPGRVLLDTIILVALLRGDQRLETRLKNTEEVFTSVVALGELLYGARRSMRAEENRAQVDQLVQDMSVLPCNRLTAEVYSRLKDDLRQKGRPIPDNDLWVAATAVQYDLRVAHRDDHFDAIDGLDEVRW